MISSTLEQRCLLSCSSAWNFWDSGSLWSCCGSPSTLVCTHSCSCSNATEVTAGSAKKPGQSAANNMRNLCRAQSELLFHLACGGGLQFLLLVGHLAGACGQGITARGKRINDCRRVHPRERDKRAEEVRAARGFPTEVCGQLFVCSAGRQTFKML
jgi:hypothetical protein